MCICEEGASQIYRNVGQIVKVVHTLLPCYLPIHPTTHRHACTSHPLLLCFFRGTIWDISRDLDGRQISCNIARARPPKGQDPPRGGGGRAREAAGADAAAAGGAGLDEDEAAWAEAERDELLARGARELDRWSEAFALFAGDAEVLPGRKASGECS